MNENNNGFHYENCQNAYLLVYERKKKTPLKIVPDGRIKIVDDFDKTIYICRKLCEQFDFGSAYIEEEIKKFGKFVMCLELTPEHITGKIINEN